MNVVSAVAWSCSAIAAAGLANELANISEFPVLQRRPSKITEPNVVACIAARNEAATIARCIASLTANREIRSIIVCDDASTDATYDILLTLARNEPRLKVVRAEKPGKSGALATASRAALDLQPHELLFVDADVRLLPGCLASLLEFKARRRAELVSVWPRRQIASFFDLTSTLALFVFLLQALPMRLLRSSQPRAAAANGQILLVDAGAYVVCGGHAEIQEYVEDVALAKAVRQTGGRIALASGVVLAECDAYGGYRANVLGFGRSLAYGAGVTGAIAFAMWNVASFVAPFAVLAFAPVAALPGALAAIAAYGFAAQRARLPIVAGLLAPSFGTATAILALHAAFMKTMGEFAWRGRSLDRHNASRPG